MPSAVEIRNKSCVAEWPTMYAIVQFYLCCSLSCIKLAIAMHSCEKYGDLILNLFLFLIHISGPAIKKSYFMLGEFIFGNFSSNNWYKKFWSFLGLSLWSSIFWRMFSINPFAFSFEKSIFIPPISYDAPNLFLATNILPCFTWPSTFSVQSSCTYYLFV